MTTDYEQFRDALNRGATAAAVQLADAQLAARGGHDVFWATQLALAYTRDRQPRRAIDAAELALASAPGNLYALLARADARLAADSMAEALTDYDEVLRAAGTDARLQPRAAKGALTCLARLQRWSELLEQLPGWLSGAPADAWRAKALTHLGRTAEAAELCRRWLATSPDHPEALWLLTECEIATQGLDPVLERLGRLARIPSRPPVYREIYASLCRRAGRNADALAQYEKLTAASGSPRMQRQQVFTLAKTGREAEALPLMEELLRADPADFYLHAAYGAACKRAAALERGLAFYEKLLERHPEHRELYGRMRRLRQQLEATTAAPPPAAPATKRKTRRRAAGPLTAPGPSVAHVASEETVIARRACAPGIPGQGPDPAHAAEALAPAVTPGGAG